MCLFQMPNTTPRLNDGSKLSHSLRRESSQRTAAEVEQRPAAPKTEPVSLRGVRHSEEEQGHSLGIGLHDMRYRRQGRESNHARRQIQQFGIQSQPTDSR